MNGNKIVRNFIWRFLERSGVQITTFITSIILARLLSPEDYGKIAIVTVFITILNIFVDSGFGSALIQKKSADDLDYSSVFFVNMGMCIGLYFFLYCTAPLIAKFYSDSTLISMIRAIGITLVISGVKNVQMAYVSKNMMFKKFFYSTLVGTMASTIIGIYMAYKGYGAWALIVQSVSNNFIDTLILWLTVSWKPKFIFSITRVKNLFSFGWKLLFISLINSIYDNLRSLIIGKRYTASDLAFYSKGSNWPSLLTSNINSAITSVLFPAMSELQENLEGLKVMTRRAISVSSYVISPLLLGLSATGEGMVSLIFGEKWLPCVFFMRIFCISFMIYPIEIANTNVIKALGKGEYVLKIEIVKKVVGLILLGVSIPFGVKWIAISLLLTNITGVILHTYPNYKLLNYGIKNQIEDVWPNFALSIIMAVVVYMIGKIELPMIVVLTVQIITGICIYLLLSIITKNKTFNYCLSYIKIRKENK